MSKHHGEHPRFGSMDVCPLVPVANITMEETIPHAHQLARRFGEHVGLTIYCYEHAATQPAVATWLLSGRGNTRAWPRN